MHYRLANSHARMTCWDKLSRPIHCSIRPAFLLSFVALIGLLYVAQRSQLFDSGILTTVDGITPSKYSSSNAHIQETNNAQSDNPPWPELTDLVMVAGHAIYTHPDRETEDIAKDENWFLQENQKGQLSTFIQHIKEGVIIAAKNPSAVLMFSGGETREPVGPESEAQSYWEVADYSGWFGYPQVRTRASTEEFAMDSFQNLLFSLCRFRELTGRYPKHITVVGFSFKSQRFTDLHRAALRFPVEQFDYFGVDPDDGKDYSNVDFYTQQAFRQDPFGCTGSLKKKRDSRNPFNRHHGYQKACPEIRELFSYCDTGNYTGKVPWQKL